MATLFTLILTALVAFFSTSQVMLSELIPLPPTFAYIAIASVIVSLFIYIISFFPLQQNEQHLTPRLFELFKKDRLLFLLHLGLIAVTFTILLMTFHPLKIGIDPFYVGFILIGVAFDLLYWQVKRILSYLNPYPVAKMITKAAEISIFQGREIELCENIDSLSEIGMKSLNRFNSSLCTQCLDEMREVMRLFLAATKSIAFESKDDKEAKARGITDEVSYTLFFFFDRINIIFQKALSLQHTSVCSSIISLLGKVCLYAAKCDLSLASYVAHYIGKFSIFAEKNRFSDIALKGTCTLVEVSKSIINDVPLAYMDLKTPFFTIINQLDEIAKATFRQNKQSSIPFLSAPFKDLKEVFKNPKVVEHVDAPAIQSELDRVLAEWSTLEAVMQTMPVITPDFMDEKKGDS